MPPLRRGHWFTFGEGDAVDLPSGRSNQEKGHIANFKRIKRRNKKVAAEGDIGELI